MKPKTEQKEIKKTGNALQLLAERMSVSPEALKQTLKATAFKDCKNDADFISAVIVANKYNLNPLTKEIYVFPQKGGGVCPIVSVDGWISLVNRQHMFDGVELVENFGEEKNTSGTFLESVTAKFHLKDKSHPVVITEYMAECYNGNKEPWKKWPSRMLRHKAYIQGARVAFGFSGIYDEDEAERIIESTSKKESADEFEMPREKKVNNKKEVPSYEDPNVVVYDTPELPEEELPCDPEIPTDPDACSACGVKVKFNVQEYSKNKFGRVLCYDCQQEVKI